MGTVPSRFYGVLCEPRAEGKYLALLYLPGAGVRPYRGATEMAGRGIITFTVGIHGIPVTMEQGVYDALGAGALHGYQFYGMESRDRYYYKPVNMGCVRANEFRDRFAEMEWQGSGCDRRQPGRRVDLYAPLRESPSLSSDLVLPRHLFVTNDAFGKVIHPCGK